MSSRLEPIGWLSTRPAAVPSFCTRPNCDVCLRDGVTHPLDFGHDAFSIPVKDQDQQFGVLIVRNPGLESVAAWQLPLLEAVARNIAAALRANEQTEHRRRLALLEERNAIARELHDSLAQSLSYLKIQISRLQTLLGGAKPTPEVRDIVAELREGLGSAYRQLRELLTTFRLKMEHPRLEDSLRDTVAEFRAEEIEHRDEALAQGAEQAPAYPVLSAGIKAASRLAFWLSTRF